MELFSRCSDCITCSASGGCLAGHGDDDYAPASQKVLQKRMAERIKRIKETFSQLEYLIEDCGKLSQALNVGYHRHGLDGATIRDEKQVFKGICFTQGELHVISENRIISFDSLPLGDYPLSQESKPR